MDSKFLVPAIGWGVLALIVIVLAIYRMSVGSREDDVVHLNATESAMANTQTAFAQKLEAIDRVGKALTVVAVTYGVGLLAWAIRDAWVSGSMMPK